MRLMDSAKKLFGAICATCGSAETEYKCTRCGRKFCASCISGAGRLVEEDLKAVRNASLLAGNHTVTNLVLGLLGRASDTSTAFCPRCNLKAMDRLASGKRLGNMSEISPCCKRLPE